VDIEDRRQAIAEIAPTLPTETPREASRIPIAVLMNP
jgi:hypothetical protein